MRRALALAALALAAACSDGPSVAPPPPCDVTRQTGCGAGLYCEVQGTTSACFAPVLVRGTVADPITVTSIGGARVVALDPNRAPVSTVATSSALGTWELAVHAARDASGQPVSASITLRADAQNYQTFPGGIRPALPIDLSTATLVGGRWVVTGPLTALQLLPLPAGSRSAIHGTLALPPSGQAPLVVAQAVGGGAGMTGIADRDGSYAIFNLVPDATYAVTAYAQGVNYAGVVTGLLDPGTNTTVAALGIAGAATATFGGNIIANNSPNPTFQVTLVVDSTYATTLDRGESPPGLTVAGSFGNPGYTFTGVPNGTYRVLAAFGKDGDVRDVSGTGNTASPQVTVSGGAVVGTPPGFKIIPAVDLVSIGGVAVGADPVVVVTSTATPTFHWQRGSADAQSATYRVQVFDAFGGTAFSADQAAVSGDNAASCSTLVPGIYQLRILAIKEAMPVPAAYTQDSQTEDLAGVFEYRP